MRCFIAIDIDEAIREALRDLQKRLAGGVDIKRSDVKWVEPDNIHLTLKFLGEIKDEAVSEICEIVEGVSAGHKSFDLDIESVGYFGGRSARVLWVGTGEGSGELCRLQAELEEQLAAGGWPKEARKFNGHLTLCRIRNPAAGVKLAKLAEGYRDIKLGVTFADSICVYQSELTPKGPIYRVLGNYKLQS